MTIKYKLPTPDGKFVLVESQQAGQSIRLPSGGEIEVPTLLGLKQLEQVVETAQSNSGRQDDNGWNVLQGGFFVVGSGILLLAVLLGGYRYTKLPALPAVQEVEVDSRFDNLEGAQLYQAWLAFESVQLTDGPPSKPQEYDDERAKFMRWLIGCAIASVVGLLLIIGAFVLPSRPTPPISNKH